MNCADGDYILLFKNALINNQIYFSFNFYKTQFLLKSCYKMIVLNQYNNIT